MGQWKKYNMWLSYDMKSSMELIIHGVLLVFLLTMSFLVLVKETDV
jgi:hypothetical protein